MTTNPDKLAILNKHERDNHIIFDEPTHTYTIDGLSDYMSVTTWIHTHFKEFNADLVIKNMMSSKYWERNKYYGKTAEEIKNEWEENRNQAALAGTKMHYDIECYYNDISVNNNSTEYKYFQDFIKANPKLKPYRTEWTVWDSELKLAGSIDMVYENEDGTLMIYDWKRSKGIIKHKQYEEYSITSCISHLPDTNYWHYTLQLNTYKALLERNYNKKITKLCLVCLHPDQKSFIEIEVPELNEEILDLFELRKIQLTTI